MMKHLVAILILILLDIAYAKAAIDSGEARRVGNAIGDLYREEIKSRLNLDLEVRHVVGGSGIFVDGVRIIHFEQKALVTLSNVVGGHPAVTKDAYALLVCHEFGHILGGGPTVTTKLNGTLSVEGQADYWATAICFKRYASEIEATTERLIRKLKIPEKVFEQCREHLTKEEATSSDPTKALLICQRAIAASISFANYFNATKVSMAAPIVDIDKIAPPVSKTLLKYGSNQCRINTFVAGAYCKESYDGKCDEEYNRRPACWFVANDL
ncbi:MAG: hypothetical protein HQK50_15305 [Oligoflexia bacterium]|nr:hypothetical protein [Oligoflexia bacterium]MBF0366941.1 hypothetical protein [Oligoflexia bacterium]